MLLGSFNLCPIILSRYLFTFAPTIAPAQSNGTSSTTSATRAPATASASAAASGNEIVAFASTASGSGVTASSAA